MGDVARPRATLAAERLALVPPALLVAVALLQLVLVRVIHLSPWKGGGFGMFASTDHGQARRVRVVGIGPQGEWELALPTALQRLTAKVGHAPIAPLMLRLAHAAGDDARERGTDIERVRVIVSRVDYAKESLAPQEVILREIVTDAVADNTHAR